MTFEGYKKEKLGFKAANLFISYTLGMAIAYPVLIAVSSVVLPLTIQNVKLWFCKVIPAVIVVFEGWIQVMMVFGSIAALVMDIKQSCTVLLLMSLIGVSLLLFL